MYISLFGCAYAEKTVYPQQARLDRACLLVSLEGIIALPLMIWREVYQYDKYQLPRLEWEDVVRYSFTIIIGSVINYWLLDLLLCRY